MIIMSISAIMHSNNFVFFLFVFLFFAQNKEFVGLIFD